MTSEFVWTDPFLTEGVSGQFLSLPCFIEIPDFNANSADPDQTPRSAASDLGLHCLPMSLLLDARCKWDKVFLLLSYILQYLLIL